MHGRGRLVSSSPRRPTSPKPNGCSRSPRRRHPRRTCASHSSVALPAVASQGSTRTKSDGRRPLLSGGNTGRAKDVDLILCCQRGKPGDVGSLGRRRRDLEALGWHRCCPEKPVEAGLLGHDQEAGFLGRDQPREAPPPPVLRGEVADGARFWMRARQLGAVATGAAAGLFAGVLPLRRNG